MREAGNVVGAIINRKKSEGIRIFQHRLEKAEFASTDTIDFIGYKFAREKTSIRGLAIIRIKKRVVHIIWANLISTVQPTFVLQPVRVAQPIDRDYRIMIMQLRRYIYGGMSEVKLGRLLKGRTLRIKFPGVMSYFPLVSDMDQLGNLDGWMLHTIWTSLKIREQALRQNGITPPLWPYSKSKFELIDLQDATTSQGHFLDLRIPSFKRIGTATHRASMAHGASAVARSAKGGQYLYGLGS
jgi:RNA-directed DNA polymerase